MTTKYVVPAGDNPGGTGTEANPYNGLAALTGGQLTAGDTVILEDGTYTSEQWDVADSGTAGNPITFRPRNPYQAVLDGNSDTTFAINIGQARHYIVVENLVIKNYTSNGIQFSSFTSNPTQGVVRNNRILDCNASGITTLVTPNTDNTATPAEGILIEGNVISDVGGFGIALRSYCTSALIRRNYIARASSTAANYWGIFVQTSSLETTTSAWAVVSGTRYTLDLNDVGRGAMTVFAVAVVRADSGPFHLTEAGSGDDTWSFSSPNVEIDIGANPDGLSVTLAFSPPTVGVVCEDNEIVGTLNNSGSFDGAGAGADQHTSGMKLLRNLSRDCTGSGFQSHSSTDTELVGNVARGNSLNPRSGAGTGSDFNLTVSGGSALALQHNSGNSAEGYSYRSAFLGTGDTVTYQNNVGLNATSDGLKFSEQVYGTITETNNSSFDPTADGFAGSGTVTADPKVIGPADLRLDGPSPCIGAGTKYWAFGSQPNGFDGLRFPLRYWSSGESLGSELVTNGTDFTGGPPPTGWSEFPSGAATTVAGKLRVTFTESDAFAFQTVTVVSGTTYRFSIDGFPETAGGWRAVLQGTGVLFDSGTVTSSTTVSQDVVADTTTISIIVRPVTTTPTQYADFDNISLKELTITASAIHGSPDIGAYAVRPGEDGATRKAVAIAASVLEAGIDVVKAKAI